MGHICTRGEFEFWFISHDLHYDIYRINAIGYLIILRSTHVPNSVIRRDTFQWKRVPEMSSYSMNEIFFFKERMSFTWEKVLRFLVSIFIRQNTILKKLLVGEYG